MLFPSALLFLISHGCLSCPYPLEAFFGKGQFNINLEVLPGGSHPPCQPYPAGTQQTVSRSAIARRWFDLGCSCSWSG